MTSDPYSGFSKHCTIYYTHHTDTFLISSSSRLSISFILYNVDIWDSSFANCKIIGNSLLSCHCCIDCVLHLVKASQVSFKFASPGISKTLRFTSATLHVKMITLPIVRYTQLHPGVVLCQISDEDATCLHATIKRSISKIDPDQLPSLGIQICIPTSLLIFEGAITLKDRCLFTLAKTHCTPATVGRSGIPCYHLHATRVSLTS